MDGDHLDQALVALQAQDLLLRGGTVALQVLGEMPHQALLTVQFAGGGLQQFAQVQQIGERPLAVRAMKQVAGQRKIVQQPAQHRQHALVPPDLPVLPKLQDPFFPMSLVAVEPVQFVQAEIQRGRGQRRAQQPVGLRLRAGAQPAQHIGRLRGAEDGFPVRQVDAAHAAPAQRRPDRAGLVPVTHQHRQVRRQQGRAASLLDKAGFPPAPGLEQGHHHAGAARGHLPDVFALGDGLGIVQVGQRQRGKVPVLHAQNLRPPGGLHRFEGHGIAAVGRAEQKGPRGMPLGVTEQPVAGLHNRSRRAEVDLQRVMTTGSVAACPQVTVDVRTAERVDRLLGIADQEHALLRAVLGHPVDALEDPVLHRVGVLELIDHRHRKLAADGLGQAGSAGSGQGCIQTVQQVVEPKLRTAALLALETVAHPGCSMAQHGRGRVVDRVAVSVEPREGRMRIGRQCAALLQPLAHAAQAEAQGQRLPRVARLRQHGVEGPVAHVRKQALRVLILAPVQRRQRRAETCRDRLEVIAPGGLDRLQLCQAAAQQVVHFAHRSGARRLPGQQTADAPVQRVGVGSQDREQQVQPGPLLRIDHVTPVIPHRLGAQFRKVGFELLFEQAAAIEGVFTQHPVAPAMNGRHRRLVHPFRSQLQLPCAARAFQRLRMVVEQAPQCRVGGVGCIPPEMPRRAQQPFVDARPQFPRCGIGKGDHQDARRQQGLGEGPVATVTQHQPQIKGRDGEGLAGSGAGLDQAAPVQGKIGRIQQRDRGVGLHRSP